MKVIILAGGLGTRMGEETVNIPKPMIEINGRPMLWHIMKHYAYYGYDDFIICLGYKGRVIRDYFLNYAQMNYDCQVDLDGSWSLLGEYEDWPELDWKVTLVDTGLETQTGGRLKRVQKYIGHNQFMVTYGDGVSDVDIPQLLTIHNTFCQINQVYGTLTSINSKSRFGEIEYRGGLITSFEEKAKSSKINGGFFVFEPEVFDYIEGDADPLEGGLLTRLTKLGKLAACEHNGFWGCCDTLKEVKGLNDLCKDRKQPPWQVW